MLVETPGRAERDGPAAALALGRGMAAAIAAMLLYGIAVVVIRRVPVTPLALAVVAAISGAMLVLATHPRAIERLGFPAYAGVQLVLATACIALTYGITTLHYMVVISQATLVCRRVTVLAIWIVLAIVHVAFGAYYQGAASAAIELLAFAAVSGFVVAITGMAASERSARSELAAAHAQLTEHLTVVEDLATMQERNRLAREVHDTLGHYLTTIHVQLAAASKLIEVDRDRAAAAIARAQSVTREGLEDVRRSVAALRAAPAQGRPLPEAIGALGRELAAAGTAVELHVSGEVRALAAPAELAVFRAAQEALTNVRKHAGATRVDVSLDYTASRIALTVADDGRGTAGTDGGFGLIGVRERVGLLGGHVDSVSAPGRGFQLRVEVPA